MVSVIITTKNEADHLATCLESIVSQSYADIEIIVVDNHSSDKTVEIAKRYTKHVYLRGPERSAQRNYGTKKANGSYVLFLDADMILTTDIIRECTLSIARGKFLGVVIPERSFGVGFWAACKALERRCYEGVEWIEAARFFNKRAIESLGGYDESLTGPEDFELPQRLKARYGRECIGRINAYILHDEGKLSLAKLLAKKYYYGRKMRVYKQVPESKAYFLMQANPIARYALFFKRPKILLGDPIHSTGMLVMKALEMGALALGSLYA